MAFGPRWSLGYANTAMSLTDAPDAQARLSRFIDTAVPPRCADQCLSLRLGLQQHRQTALRLHLESEQVSRSEALVRKFSRGGHPARRQHQALPARRSPGVRGGQRCAGASSVNSGTGGPCVGQFWDGEGAHIDFTHPAGIAWWQRSLQRQLLDYGITSAGTTTTNTRSGTRTAQSHGFGTPIPIARSRPLHALLMTRATHRGAGRRYAPDERVFTVTRAGPAGHQRYAQTWVGDNTTSWHTLALEPSHGAHR